MGLPRSIAETKQRAPPSASDIILGSLAIVAERVEEQMNELSCLPLSRDPVICFEDLYDLLLSISLLHSFLLVRGNSTSFWYYLGGADQPHRYRYRDAFYLFLIGIWMGLIVLDSATYLLMLLILSMRFQFSVANGYKNIVMAIVSTISLVILAIDRSIVWKTGFILAGGSLIGGYVGAKFAMHPLAKKWTYRLLVAVIILELGHILVRYAPGR